MEVLLSVRDCQLLSAIIDRAEQLSHAALTRRSGNGIAAATANANANGAPLTLLQLLHARDAIRLRYDLVKGISPASASGAAADEEDDSRLYSFMLKCNLEAPPQPHTSAATATAAAPVGSGKTANEWRARIASEYARTIAAAAEAERKARIASPPPPPPQQPRLVSAPIHSKRVPPPPATRPVTATRRVSKAAQSTPSHHSPPPPPPPTAAAPIRVLTPSREPTPLPVVWWSPQLATDATATAPLPPRKVSPVPAAAVDARDPIRASRAVRRTPQTDPTAATAVGSNEFDDTKQELTFDTATTTNVQPVVVVRGSNSPPTTPEAERQLHSIRCGIADRFFGDRTRKRIWAFWVDIGRRSVRHSRLEALRAEVLRRRVVLIRRACWRAWRELYVATVTCNRARDTQLMLLAEHYADATVMRRAREALRGWCERATVSRQKHNRRVELLRLSTQHWIRVQRRRAVRRWLTAIEPANRRRYRPPEMAPSLVLPYKTLSHVAFDADCYRMQRAAVRRWLSWSQARTAARLVRTEALNRADAFRAGSVARGRRRAVSTAVRAWRTDTAAHRTAHARAVSWAADRAQRTVRTIFRFMRAAAGTAVRIRTFQKRIAVRRWRNWLSAVREQLARVTPLPQRVAQTPVAGSATAAAPASRVAPPTTRAGRPLRHLYTPPTTTVEPKASPQPVNGRPTFTAAFAPPRRDSKSGVRRRRRSAGKSAHPPAVTVPLPILQVKTLRIRTPRQRFVNALFRWIARAFGRASLVLMLPQATGAAANGGALLSPPPTASGSDAKQSSVLAPVAAAASKGAAVFRVHPSKRAELFHAIRLWSLVRSFHRWHRYAVGRRAITRLCVERWRSVIASRRKLQSTAAAFCRTQSLCRALQRLKAPVRGPLRRRTSRRRRALIAASVAPVRAKWSVATFGRLWIRVWRSNVCRRIALARKFFRLWRTARNSVIQHRETELSARKHHSLSRIRDCWTQWRAVHANRTKLHEFDETARRAYDARRLRTALVRWRQFVIARRTRTVQQTGSELIACQRILQPIWHHWRAQAIEHAQTSRLQRVADAHWRSLRIRRAIDQLSEHTIRRATNRLQLRGAKQYAEGRVTARCFQLWRDRQHALAPDLGSPLSSPIRKPQRPPLPSALPATKLSTPAAPAVISAPARSPPLRVAVTAPLIPAVPIQSLTQPSVNAVAPPVASNSAAVNRTRVSALAPPQTVPPATPGSAIPASPSRWVLPSTTAAASPVHAVTTLALSSPSGGESPHSNSSASSNGVTNASGHDSFATPRAPAPAGADRMSFAPPAPAAVDLNTASALAISEAQRRDREIITLQAQALERLLLSADPSLSHESTPAPSAATTTTTTTSGKAP